MFVDFGMAEQYGGNCFLRFDDTNPEAEKPEYIEHIKDIVSWMGWKPYKITHSSDYFDRLHELAVRLIKDRLAYVCHQTKDEIEESRKNLTPSPWRDRPIEENLKLFEDMRRGLIDEGKAVLRLKGDYQNENANMWDPIAYRIKFVPHPHIGDKWCIYPSYDFTHCLVDSFENITHSLCTLEFESRRASYFWLLEILGQYKPVVWEYSRLNITNMVMSKRKLNKLVTQGYVHGWDDPRLLTLAGLRRRGATPEAINSFCRECGITRSDNRVPLHRLEHFMRLDLDAGSPRAMAVLRPLKVVITNLDEGHYEERDASVFPGRSEETYKVPFTRVVYIESSDFRESDSKGYYGMAPGKSVMLRYAYVVKCTDFKKDGDGRVSEVSVEIDRSYEGKKPPEPVEVRLYSNLFKSADPDAADNFLDDLSDNSLEVLRNAYGTPPIYNAKVRDRFQLERTGYFCVDDDSSPGKIVLNRTVTLRETVPKP
uniref:glutamine--tRNA ligase n=1 Tax=Tetraselmis sp. GSL018 TaxID=582737 RepID=A0A061SG32_9CHLO